MPDARHILLVAGSALCALACGPAALTSSGATTPSLSLGDASRSVHTLSDLETVRDVVRAQGSVFLATDAGLFRFASEEGERVEGLPSEDVRALVEDGEGLLVVTAGGIVRLAAGALTPVTGTPDLGPLTDAARTEDGTVWLCGLGGVARRAASGWEVVGEPVACTTLAPTPEGQLWIGTTAGLLYVEGDVIREHPVSGGMPEGYVRAIVPVLPGEIMAILDGPSASQIAYWDGERWHGYTLRGFEGDAVGLVRRGRDVLLVGERRVISVRPGGAGVPLTPLSRAEGTVRSFRPAVTPAAEHAPAEPEAALADPKPLARIPENAPSVEAPPFTARALEVALPGRAYAGFVDGDDAYIAIENGGVLRLPTHGEPSALRTGTLVPEQDLQIATDGAGTVWMLSRTGELARRQDGLHRVATPNGLAAQAIATGAEGACLAALDPSTPNTVHLFVNRGEGWAPLAERALTLATPLESVPFIGVAPDGKVWVALEVQRETSAGTRMRGVAVIDPSVEAVVYHHRGADRAQGGLPLPDEVSAVTFDTEGNAWFASLSGLVRVGAHQAVVFDGSRGVQGEIVSDAVAGPGGIWLVSGAGIARYDGERFDYGQPAEVQEARPVRLAIDVSGRLWGASSEGLILHEGDAWRVLGADEGLPAAALVDVETDGAGDVWVLAEDRVLILTR